MQKIATQCKLGSLVYVYICNYDLPAFDIQSGRVPPPPSNLDTVLKVLNFLSVTTAAALSNTATEAQHWFATDRAASVYAMMRLAVAGCFCWHLHGVAAW